LGDGLVDRLLDGLVQRLAIDLLVSGDRIDVVDDVGSCHRQNEVGTTKRAATPPAMSRRWQRDITRGQRSARILASLAASPEVVVARGARMLRGAGRGSWWGWCDVARASSARAGVWQAAPRAGLSRLPGLTAWNAAARTSASVPSRAPTWRCSGHGCRSRA